MECDLAAGGRYQKQIRLNLWDGEFATLGVVDTRASGGVDIWDIGNVIGIQGYSCMPFTRREKLGLLARDVCDS